MPISILDLKPGDRVVLNCPKARGQNKREARFDGIFRSIEHAMAKGGIDAFIVGASTLEFLLSAKAWARFLMQTVSGPAQILEYPGGGTVKGLPEFHGTTQLIAAFVIEPDGSLREEEGRRIFIERRIASEQAGNGHDSND